jgi:hypothetical protein
VRQRARHVAHAEPLDELAPAPHAVPARAVHPGRQQHVLLAGELGHEVEELEDEADRAGAQRRQRAVVRPVDPRAVDLDRAAVEPVQPGEHVEQRGLAAARAADHRDQLPTGDVEVGAGEHEARRATASEALPDASSAYHRHGTSLA